MKVLMKELKRLNGFNEKIEISEDITVSKLIEILHKTILNNYKKDEICLVSKGKLLKSPFPIKSYNIDKNSQILILNRKLTQEQKQQFELEFKQFENQNVKIERIKKAAEKLSERVNGGNKKDENFFFQLEDQNGQEVDLPKNDRKNLVLGLTFYNKGKSLYQIGKHLDAIEYYLLSEEAFNRW